MVPVETAEGARGADAWPAASPPDPVASQKAVGFAEAVERSFRRLLQVPGVYWVIAMLVAAASGFLGHLLRPAQPLAVVMPPLHPAFVVVGFVLLMLLVLFVLVPFGAATTRAALAVLRDEPVRLRHLGAGFRRYGSVLAVVLVSGIPLILAGAVAAGIGLLVWVLLQQAVSLPAAILVSIVVGLFFLALLLVPALYVVLRWSFALFVVFDREEDAVEALRRSWHLAEGRLLTLLGVVVVTGSAAALAGIAPPLLVFTTGWAPLAVGEVYMDARDGRVPPVRNWDQETWADTVVVREDED